MKFSRTSLSALTLALAASGAGAAVIDTTGIFTGNIFPFGYPNTATYGQTFTVSGPDTVLNGFSLYLDGNYTQDVRGYVGNWDGSKVGNILYTSATVSVSGAGLHELAFSTGGLALTQGSSYVAFLSVSELLGQSGAAFDMPFGTNSIEGQFVYINNGTDFAQLTSTPWSLSYVGDDDVWFKADFGGAQSVPEPSSLALAGFGIAALLSRRKAARA